ncbi:MAG TPA: Ig-like domain-containing protein, partial [Gemmatimonadales bacterium]|nr:Ig-like domain-containing protein [Gemmatimonadales bacterium]
DVSVATTGDGSDPDGYGLLLDGTDRGAIGVNATSSLNGLTPGSHTLGLTGIAANCQLDGANPQNVTVTAGQSLPVSFSITCSSPAPTAGTIQVTTSTGGPVPDPDGYAVSVDGGSSQPIGANGSLNLLNITAGQHSLQLSGIASNCTVSGANPRSASVPPGGTVSVAFSVTCVNPPPGTGSVQVSAATTGASPDPDGYTVAVDNAGARPLPVNGTISVGNLSAGTHTVTLNGLAGNCSAADNPRTVTVTAGQSTPVAFAVTCTATGPSTGQVRIIATTTGSSRDPDGYTVTIDGGATQPLDINGSRTVNGLTPASHTVTLGGVASNCTVAGGLDRTVTVTAGETATVSFSVSCAAVGGSVNLRIERMYLTQSTQAGDGSVPLVQGREAYLRVFVTASGPNSPRPPVRVRFFQNGSSAPTQTLTIPADGGSTPTSVQEGTLGSSWNLRVPAALIQPNTTVLADVDPENAVAEPNEGDNSFPATGTPRPLGVRAVPPLSIQFVPVRQAANGLTGTVGNVGALLDLARRMHPLNEIRTSVHSVYTTTTQLPLEGSDGNDAWERVLEEIEMMRLIEGGPNQHYFGLVRVNYGAGVNGIGYVGVPSAVGSDDPADVGQVVAHELGHNWGRWHSPCGNPGGLDPSEPYPYSNGRIGVFGLDLGPERVRPPSDPDIMGYCPNPWISDHTWNRVLSFRASAGSSSSVTTRDTQLSVVVWGRIQSGRMVLEPAFQVVTRPRLPTKPGPYTLEATAGDGSRLFSLSFDAVPVADKGSGSRHFAFAVPLSPARAAQLTTLRLQGPGAPVAAIAQSPAAAARGARPDAVNLKREGDGVTLEWDAGAHPMIVVRDPDTGEVLSMARGGRARIATGKAELNLEVSDGVRSYELRRAISR